MAAALISGALTVVWARRPPKYTVRVTLRATEGAIRTQADFGVGALRAHVTDMAFTRARVADLAKRNAAYLGKDPDAAYEAIRENLKVEIVESDLIGDSDETDPPRNARVTLSFTGSRPQAVWQITHELADLLIDSALARQHAYLMREQAASKSAVGRAQTTSDDAPDTADRRSLLDRLKASEAKAAVANLGLRAADEKQGLRFEMVDPGRMPKVVSRTSVIGNGIVAFVIVLLAACLLVGAFDPRVLTAGDLADLGVPLLGRLPPLPAPPNGPPEAPRNASPPSADHGPRV